MSDPNSRMTMAHLLQRPDDNWGVEGLEKAGTEKIPGGIASGKKASSFDAKALAAGAKVEMEHTKDPKVAQEIAKDHLTEDAKYYEKLARMEKSEDEEKKEGKEKEKSNGKADAAIRSLLAKNPKPDDSEVHALAGKLSMEVDDLEEKIYAMLGKKMKKSGLDALEEHLSKAGPYIGPKGGKWADPGHKIPWHGGDKTKQMKSKLENLKISNVAKKKALEEQHKRSAEKRSELVAMHGKKLAEVRSKASSGVLGERIKELKAKIKQTKAETKKIDQGLAAEDRKAEKSMGGLGALEEHLEKAKYTKRTGTPGSYKYEYADASGKKVSGEKKQEAENIKGVQALRDAPDGSTVSVLRGPRVGSKFTKKNGVWRDSSGDKSSLEGLSKLQGEGRFSAIEKPSGKAYKEGERVSYQGHSGTVKRTQGDMTMVDFDGSGTTAKGIVTERLSPEVKPPPSGKKVSVPSKGAEVGSGKEKLPPSGKPIHESKKIEFLSSARNQTAVRVHEGGDKWTKYVKTQGKWVDQNLDTHTNDEISAKASGHALLDMGKIEKSMSAIDTLEKALPSKEADISPEKARQILHDGEVHGKPLTEQQRKFFGAIGGHLPAPKAKKAEKSMTALDTLTDFVGTGEEALSKGLVGGYGLDWANRMGGSPFEAEALQCIKDLNAAEYERKMIRKKHDKPWDERHRMDPVERAKLNKKTDAMYKKCDEKEYAIRMKMDEVEKKYLDWRIEQAKETRKSETEDVVTATEKLEEHLEKSDIPTGQPTKLPTGEASSNPEDGGPLAGVGKPSGSEHPPNPDNDQDAQGNPKDVPAPKGEDWSAGEEARRVFGGLGGTMKSMGSLDQDRAIAESRLRKGVDDVHPYRMSAVHGDADARAGALSKGPANESNPRNAIIARDLLCKSCGHNHPAMLTACPHCGDGTIGREMLAKSNPGVSLDPPRGAPILRPPPQVEDILIKE